MPSIFDPLNGVYCNTHDDLAHKQIYGTKCLGGKSLLLYEGPVYNIQANVPAELAKAPRMAQIIVEKDASQPAGEIVARFTMCGADPSTETGFPIGHMGTFCVGGNFNINNFKIVGIPPFVPKVRVMYFE